MSRISRSTRRALILEITSLKSTSCWPRIVCSKWDWLMLGFCCGLWKVKESLSRSDAAVGILWKEPCLLRETSFWGIRPIWVLLSKLVNSWWRPWQSFYEGSSLEKIGLGGVEKFCLSDWLRLAFEVLTILLFRLITVGWKVVVVFRVFIWLLLVFMLIRGNDFNLNSNV